ncbi:hypothetical protein FKG94_21435 [Exilibacterium tricleocarpae]|uniref:Beta/gamma crystallin 'Greek key' domain-containing protein n=1 Tax=Exilibacterium tricleocarpae TaxID=2591008 RepID=A0A545T037_9GAMM|nr:peptidase inhibitor family I36 protein [Exilibacterium tricleocarpae]TQV70585.1 hypothetical protein FKG94_21435 [Exilibacterium tricleocarpae]
MKRKMSLISLLTFTLTAFAGAQDKVCFYENPDYQGEEWCYGIGDTGWIGASRNDRVSSIKVYGDAYVTIYQHSNYGGSNTVVMANTYKMDRLDDEISSFKVAHRWGNDFACLFEHPGFRGTPACLEAGRAENDLDNTAFGRNKASSLMVVGKASVEVFEYPNFDGNHRSTTLIRSTSNLEKRPGGWVEDNIDSFRVHSRNPNATEAALDINEAVGHYAPINQVSVLAAHNAFNSTAYFGGQLIPGPNQRRALIEQLEVGARFFELDVSEGNGYAKVCHSVDCGLFDASLRRMLGEVDTWLKGADQNDVVFFYIQDDINGSNSGYAQLQSDIGWLGDVVFTGGACRSLPDALSFAQIRAQGKRVFFYKDDGTTGCDIATSVMVNTEINKGVSSINVYEDHFNRGAIVRSQECNNNFCNDVISPFEALIGLQNGVNAFGIDMLDSSDIDHNGVFNAQLWSIGPADATDPYAPGRTAVFKPTGQRFMALGWASAALGYACRDSGGNWAITTQMGEIEEGVQVCSREFPGYHFDVPVSAYEAKRLRDVITAGAGVHVNFGVSDGQWAAGAWGRLSDR